MLTFLFKYIMNSLNITIFIVLLLFLQPLLKKHFSAVCLYQIWVVLLIALLLPIRIEFTKSLFSIHLPLLSTEMKVSKYLPTQEPRESDDLLSTINLAKDSECNNQLTNLNSLSSYTAYLYKHLSAIITFLIQNRYIGVWLIWIIGIFFSLYRNNMRYRRYIKQLKRFLSPIVDKDVLLQFEECKKELNCYYKKHKNTPIYKLPAVTIYRCPILTSPMSLGIFNPVILLPEERYSKMELRFLLLHELIHIRRHDAFIKLLRLIVVSIHWYNPFCYLLSRHVDNWCENACDETVLHKSTKSECIEYCKLLLKCALTQTELRTTLISSFYGGKNNMKNRIYFIMNQVKKRPGRLLLAFIAVIVSMTVFISVSNYKDVFASTKIADSKLAETLSSEGNINSKTSAKKNTSTTNSINVKPVTAKTTKSEAATVSKNTADADTLRKEIVSLANQSKDVPYLWGGNDLSTGVDCSGFVQAIYKKLDYELPRTSREQLKECEAVSFNNLLPGDLIFYNSTNDASINHVAIYIGNEQVIHSKNYKVGVTVEDIDYREPYKAGRIIVNK